MLREETLKAEAERFLAGEVRIDRETFCRLYASYYPRIFSFVVKRVGNPHDSEDITARTFEKALRCINNFDPGKGNFSSWLYKIAVNVTNDYLSDNSTVGVSLDELERYVLADSQDDVADAGRLADVIRIIQKLNKNHQVVLVLRYMEDMDYDELSEIIGCSKKALSMRLTRALKAFTKVASEEGFF